MSDEQRKVEFGAEVINLAKVNFTPGLLRCIPAELVREYRVLPVFERGDELGIAVADPSDLHAIDDLHGALRRVIYIHIAGAEQIDSFIEQLYGNTR